MTDTTQPGSSPSTQRVYSRPDPDGSEEGLQAWAEAFVDAVLGEPQPQSGSGDTPGNS